MSNNKNTNTGKAWGAALNKQRAKAATGVVKVASTNTKKPTASPKTNTTTPKKSTQKQPPNNKSKKPVKPLNVKILVAKVLIFVLLVGGAVFGSMWNHEVERFVNHTVLQNKGGAEIVFDNGMSVHFIDVGQADAICVQFPNGQIMMVDSGVNTTKSRNAMKDYLQNYIFIDNKPTIIDWFVLTHSDADHVGGAVVLFSNYTIKEVYRPATFTLEEHQAVTRGEPIHGTTFTGGFYTLHQTKGYKDFVTNLENVDKVTFHKDATPFTVGNAGNEVSVNILKNSDRIYYGSESAYANNEGRASNPVNSNAKAINSQSPYIVLEYKTKKIMLTGDATDMNELEYVDTIGQMDVFKLSHHGARGDNSLAFFQKVKPTYAVICVGKNSHGHPHQEVFDRLTHSTVGVLEEHIYTTQKDHNVIIDITAAGEIEINGVKVSPNVWVSYWMLASGLLLIVASALFANELVRLGERKK